MLLDALDYAGALDLEALGANPNALHPGDRRGAAVSRAAGHARPPATRCSTAARSRPRALQDPLSFRTLAQLNGAARDAFGFVGAQLAIELNAAQSNPLVLVDEGRVISVGNFEIQPLATALDLARLALAPVISSAAERAVKLLQAPLTGLTEGLGARPAMAESALSEFGIAVQAFAAEARLLAQPVSFELVSTTQAEGIEDRMTMAPLAARRLEEMVELGARVVSIELMLAAQACDLRGARARGRHGARCATRCGAFVPFLDEGDVLPDLEPLVDEIRSGQDRALTCGRDRRPPAPAAAGLHRGARGARRHRRASSATSSRLPEGAFAFDLGEHDLESAARAARPRRDRRRRALAAADPRARRAPGRRARASSWQPGRRASLEVVPRSGGRFVALAAGPTARRASPARRVGSDALADLDALAPVLDVGCAGTGASSSSTRRAVPVPAARPPGGWRSRLHGADAGAPTLAWLAGGQERWPDVSIVFAILAGGAPFQLERLALARRRRPLRPPSATSSSTRRRTAGARSSSASRPSASSSSSTAATCPSSTRRRPSGR